MAIEMHSKCIRDFLAFWSGRSNSIRAAFVRQSKDSDGIRSAFQLHSLKINSSSGKKKRKLILTESNETYTECSRLQINDMCQTVLEENVYWLSNEHRKTRKSR